MELFLFLVILIPWMLFGFVAKYMRLKNNKKRERAIIIRMIIELVIIIIFGFLFFYLPEEYDKYLVFVLALISIITTYMERN